MEEAKEFIYGFGGMRDRFDAILSPCFSLMLHILNQTSLSNMVLRMQGLTTASILSIFLPASSSYADNTGFLRMLRTVHQFTRAPPLINNIQEIRHGG
ncbi:MAG: hypothetical protein M3247_03550 [Thermoproteota archaeon]|nr:hypothetical protein [Thermoproteota archaeon]